MKKIVLTLLTIGFIANVAMAQQDKAAVEAAKKDIADKVKKAEEDLVKNPTKPKSHLNKAIALLDLASFPDSTLSALDIEAPFKALDAIKEAQKLDPKGSLTKDIAKLYDEKKVYQAFMNIGVIKYQGKNYAASYKYMAKASEVAPKDSIA
ncbi:MAG: hypothetical protein RIQ98_235, partial [Bacteroidota bacterium]